MGLWSAAKRYTRKAVSYTPVGMAYDATKSGVKAVAGGVNDAASAIHDASGDLKDWTMENAVPAVGAGISSAVDVLSGNRDRRHNAREAEKNRQFQKDMRSTEVQDRMADLAAAGINPMMAGDHAAGTVQGSMAAPSNVAQGAQGLMDRGLGLLSQLTQIRKVESESKVNDASALKMLTESGDIKATQGGRVSQLEEGLNEIKARILSHGADVGLKGSQTRLTEAQIAAQRAIVREIDQRVAKLRHETNSAQSQADKDRVAAQFATGIGGDIQRWSDAIGLKGRDITDMMSIIGVLGKVFKRDKR